MFKNPDAWRETLAKHRDEIPLVQVEAEKRGSLYRVMCGARAKIP